MKPKKFLKIFISITIAVLISTSQIKARDFVHIFTSKGIYETCEDLWFKCLVMDGSTFSLSSASQTAFVEILNPADSVVWKEKYPVVDGVCNGQIYVGDDWETGEYRMYVNTAGTIGRQDTILTPKKLLIVRELPEVQRFISQKTEPKHKLIDSIAYGRVKPLKLTIELDSTEYHTRSKVKGRIKVSDPDGRPVRAKISLSVADRLYAYASGELDILSHCIAMQEQHDDTFHSSYEPILPNCVVSGSLKSQKKKVNVNLDSQVINVFDFTNKPGNLNLIFTEPTGRFAVPMDMAMSLGWDILLRPLSSKEIKAELTIDDPFESIRTLRNNSKDIYYPIIISQKPGTPENDSIDYTGRRIARLDEVIVKGHAGRYPKRNKLLGYLDSISTLYGNAWVCGCPSGGNTTFLNDYIPGYTHHPDGWGRPDKISRPVKGKDYEVIKYSGGTADDYVVDIRHVTYEGPRYSEEELLRKNGLWKAKGYYPQHHFESPDADELSIGLEDNRNTLLWSPEATTDTNGEYEFEFYTSDINSSFELRCLAYTCDSGQVGENKISFRVVTLPDL